jgi:hypothetical protein
MKVLVSFFSDQHFLPVHQGFKHLSPEKHILLHTQTSINLSKRFTGNVLFQVVENSSDSIVNALNQIIEQHQNDELLLNLSGGSDLMQLVGLDVARRKKFNAYRFEPNAMICFSENGIERSELPTLFTIEEYIKLHGFRVIKNSEEMIAAQKLLGALSGYLTATHLQKLK